MKRSHIAGAVLVLLVAFIVGMTWRNEAEPVSTLSNIGIDSPILVIDPGHGGEDGGAVSLSGAHESDINLAIAKRMDAALGLIGYPSHMLRETDTSLHNEDAVTIRQKKVSDLHNRAASVSAHENAVLISIHQNSYPGSQYRGAQVFFRPDERSKSMAECMQQALVQYVDPTNHRIPKQVPKDIYLFNHITCPAILIECGFLTNPEEELLLQRPEYQTKLAVTIAASYLKHYT